MNGSPLKACGDDKFRKLYDLYELYKLYELYELYKLSDEGIPAKSMRG